jgi:hypothetical protein
MICLHEGNTHSLSHGILKVYSANKIEYLLGSSQMFTQQAGEKFTGIMRY